jgi:hypothetical protein
MVMDICHTGELAGTGFGILVAKSDQKIQYLQIKHIFLYYDIFRFFILHV